jgi:hypothetical protein
VNLLKRPQKIPEYATDLCNETQLDALFFLYFINQLVYVSGLFIARHWEVFTVYTATGAWYTFKLTDCGQQPFNLNV